MGTIFDRGAALRNAVLEKAGNLSRLQCRIHIDRNLVSKKMSEVVDLYHIAHGALSLSLHPQAHEYLLSIPDAFLFSVQSVKFYDMVTSNLIEQLNSEFLPERIVQYLFTYWYHP